MGISVFTAFASINFVRLGFLLAGWVALAIGILGLILPLLPGTPFLILAAWCFARGSERAHDWLVNHRLIGRYIRNFRDHQVIPLPAKIAAVFGLVTSVMFLICVLPNHPAIANEVWLLPIVEAAWPIPTLVGMINAVVGAYILSRPSRRPPAES